MKRTLLTSAILVAFGFAAGWFFKSATQDLATIEQTIHSVAKRTPPAASQDSPPDSTPPPLAGNSGNRSPGMEPVPGSDGAEPPRSSSELDNARWLRLGEVLGLDAGQTKALEALIAESRPDMGNGQNLDTAYAKAGVKLEEKMLAALTPEQREEFKKLQLRDRENRVESKALQSYEAHLGNLDLTANQREQAMDALRQDAEQQVSSIADSTRLLLADSFLPIGDERLTEDGFRLLGQLKSSPGTQPFDIEALAAIKREEIASKMNRFEGILTPGQLARYRIALEESLANLAKIAPRQ